MRADLALVILLAGLLAGPALADCLSYAGRVELAGVLARRTFPGPPNYESIARGDRAETAWLVRLERPACVAADPADSINLAVEDLREVQLVLTPEQLRRNAGLVGRRVALSGRLFGAHTGHHRTPVLLDDVRFR